MNDLSNNPGVIIFKLGEARIQTGKYELVHIIDLSEINNMILDITQWMRNVTNSTNFSKMLRYKFGQLQKVHNNLILKRRKKRAIEFIGSAIKFIGGNPDAADFREMDYKISTMTKEINQLVDRNNDQFTINDQIKNRINNVTKIVSRIISKSQENDLKVLNDLDVINLIFNIDIAYGILREIEDAMLFSKLGLISKNMIDVEEIDLIIDLLEKQDVVIDSREEALEYLDVKIFYEKNSIVIMIDIPQLKIGKFEKLLMKPIAMNRQQILIEHEYVLTNGEKTYGLIRPCMKIGKFEVCKNEDFVFLEDSCISKIIKDQESRCNSRKSREEAFIEVIQPGKILVKTTNETQYCMTNTCGLGPEKRTIPALKIMLMTFENCSVTINNTSYENYELEMKKQNILYPIDEQKVKVEENVDVAELYDLHLDQKNKLEKLNWNHKIIKYASYGISSTIVVGVMIVMTILVITRTRSKPKLNQLTVVNHQPRNWDSSNLTKEELKATLF